MDAACALVDRDPVTLERTVGILVDQRPASAQTSLHYVSLSTRTLDSAQQPLTGGPVAIAEDLRRFGEAGFAQVQISTSIDGMAGVEAMAPVLELLRQGVSREK